MEKRNKILGFLLIVSAGAFFASVVTRASHESMRAPKTQVDTVKEKTDTASGLKPQTNDEGDVEIGLIPLDVTSSQEWKFGISLSTHSVDLSMDLEKSVVLVAADKREIKPISYSGDPSRRTPQKRQFDFSAGKSRRSI